MADELEVTILPDGSIKIDSPDKISAANHTAAGNLFRELAKAGRTTNKRSGKGRHTHAHQEGSHTHEH